MKSVMQRYTNIVLECTNTQEKRATSICKEKMLKLTSQQESWLHAIVNVNKWAGVGGGELYTRVYKLREVKYTYQCQPEI